MNEWFCDNNIDCPYLRESLHTFSFLNYVVHFIYSDFELMVSVQSKNFRLHIFLFVSLVQLVQLI